MKPLGRLFRGKFLAYLEAAFWSNRLLLHGRLRDLQHPMWFQDWLSNLKGKEWVVYAKPPFGGPENVLQYLARYTHRVAISNRRLLSLENGHLRFRWRDSQHGNQIKEMVLDAVEFIRRFLMHILPTGFVKIRHYGFLSNRNRLEMLQRCRAALPTLTAPVLVAPTPSHRCPVCQIGTMQVIELIPSATLLLRAKLAEVSLRIDSS